jgi:hypothetical protein
MASRLSRYASGDLVTNSVYCLGNPIQVPYSLGSENERRLSLERGKLCVSVYSTKAKASQ